MTLFTFYFHAFLRASAAVVFEGFGYSWRVLIGSRKYLSVGCCPAVAVVSVAAGDRSPCPPIVTCPISGSITAAGDWRVAVVPSVRVPRCSSRCLSLLLAPGTLQQLGHLSHTTTIPTTTAAPYINISASLSS